MNKENMMSTLLDLPDSIQNIILENTEYKGEVISTDDKRKLLSMKQRTFQMSSQRNSYILTKITTIQEGLLNM